jgi:flagellar basal-body rod modification protein FlgD
MSSSITSSGTPSLSSVSTTAPTTQVGPNANNPQMNQFLTLLTAQLQNQDPTSPTDPTQFVAQLAQFSTVEQLVQSNTTLSTISQGLSGLTLGQYAGLINHTVNATATSVTAPVSSTPQNLTYNVTATGLNNVNIQITNSSGTVVRSVAASGSSGTITFDGLDSKGNQLPNGQYSRSAPTARSPVCSRHRVVPGSCSSPMGGWCQRRRSPRCSDLHRRAGKSRYPNSRRTIKTSLTLFGSSSTRLLIKASFTASRSV